jgi:hypothetical protein
MGLMKTQSQRLDRIERTERLVGLGQEEQFGHDFGSQTTAFAIA